MATTRQVRFPSSTDGVTLAGALAEPMSPARVALVLVSGSGPQDRDETIADTRPFRDLREALVAHGHAALSWDDRGVGGSGGDYLASSGAELAADVLQALVWLRERLPEAALVVAGHSQGALIAAETATRRPDLAGLALLAGAGRPGKQVLHQQHLRITEAEGWDEESAQAVWQMKADCFAALTSVAAASGAPADLQEQLTGIVIDHHESWGMDVSASREQIDAIVEDLMEWEWRYLLRSDPAASLERVACPVFAAAGSRDTQIDARADLAAMERALRDGTCPAAQVVLVPGLNHLFQRAVDGSPSAYSTSGPTFVDDVIEPLTAWLDGLAS